MLKTEDTPEVVVKRGISQSSIGRLDLRAGDADHEYWLACTDTMGKALEQARAELARTLSDGGYYDGPYVCDYVSITDKLSGETWWVSRKAEETPDA